MTRLAGRMDLLVQSVTDYAIYMLDADGIVVSWNAGAQRFKGYAASEIIGQHFSRFYTDEDKQAGIPALALETAAGEGRFEAEGWRVRKDGTRFWANVVIDPIRDESGALLGFAKVTRDLTDRKLAEEELRRSEERFRLLVQGVTDYAIYLLDPGGRITSWNAGAQRFKGYAAQEIIGEHFSRFYTPEEVERGMPARALETALRDGRYEAEGWRVRKDGTRFWANVVIDPIRNPEGQLIGFAKITRDLTERRDAQLAIDEAREAFFQSQKMEAIGQLTGGVAHDFNNLLSAILGSIDLAERRLPQDHAVGQFLRNARQAAERGKSLTQRMLAFARKQELDIQTVDLAATVRGMAELLARTIGHGIEIDTRFPLVLPPVRVDRAQLELALVNLVVNARDAMPEGGRIVISARRDAEHDSGGTGGGFVRLCVADEGEGMDESVLQRATEPFFTTKGVGKGTGLGLSMVRGMIEQCGGRLELSSRLGEGTTAELILPAADEPAKPEAAAPAPAEQPAPQRLLRVLAVDDDPIILMNTVVMLEDMGHQVLEAGSCQEALGVIGEHEIDLLLTDYAMPGQTGSELVEAARARRPGLRAILVSGYADLPNGQAIEVPRLAKPFDQAELARAVADATADA